jgi:hypothetical protein
LLPQNLKTKEQTN